ncbi:MAG: hypothetical protein MJ237_03285 [bacterium]|nr:hypothetical protein [bacterium]
MSKIQAKPVINKLTTAAQKSKNTLLDEVEGKMAAKTLEKATISAAEFREGVNAVKDAKNLVVPPAETWRAYSGIDPQPIVSRFPVQFPKHKI